MKKKSEGKGYFVISLDFELMWGVLDLPSKVEYSRNIIQGRDAIPHILDLFEKYKIHATWATVGMIFLDNKCMINQYAPQKKPDYTNKKYSSYSYIDGIKEGKDDNLFFARNILGEIMKRTGQEIGTHTFSHYYCSEDGADAESFFQDLLAAKRIAKDSIGIELNSLVFPRNQARKEFVKAAEKAGIKIWRGNAKGYSVDKSPIVSFVNRITRLIDTYLPLYGPLCYDKPSSDVHIVCEKSSRFFRPYSEKLRMLEWLKLRRIKRQMKYAAKNGKVFHLWWHPHNFGGYPEKMLCQLETILQYYTELNNKYDYTSCSMSELIDL